MKINLGCCSASSSWSPTTWRFCRTTQTRWYCH